MLHFREHNRTLRIAAETGTRHVVPEIWIWIFEKPDLRALPYLDRIENDDFYDSGFEIEF